MIVDKEYKKDNTRVISAIMDIIVHWKSNIQNPNNDGVKLNPPKYLYDLNPIVTSILKELQDNNDEDLISLLLASSFYSFYKIKRNNLTRKFITHSRDLWIYVWNRSNRIIIYNYTRNPNITDYDVWNNLFLYDMPDLALTILSYYNESEDRLLKVFKKFIKQSFTWEDFQKWKRGEFFRQRHNKYCMI